MSDDTYAQPASEGRSRDEGAGRNQSGFSLRDFQGVKERGGRFAAPRRDRV